MWDLCDFVFPGAKREVEGGRDRSNPPSARPVPRRVRSEGSSYTRAKPASDHELQGAPDRSSSNPQRSVCAGGEPGQFCEATPFMTDDFCDHRGMQIVFLGTSSSMPTLSRNTSCIALRLGQP
jgi:hypothetical protein